MQVISSKSDLLGKELNPFFIPFGLWRHRELILQLTKREIVARYRGTYLGLLWLLVSPFLLLMIYTFVFSSIFHVRWRESVPDMRLDHFALTLFSGLVPFSVFSEVANRAPTIIVATSSYVKKVVFPLEILPVVMVGSALIHSLISIVILLIGIALSFGEVPFSIVFLPLAYLPLIFLCLGVGWFLASLGVYVRDIGQSIGLAVQMLFFLSPVLYPISAAPEKWRDMFYLNPLATILNGFRQVLLQGEMLSWMAWARWTLLLALLAWFGYVWFIKTKRGFVDVI